MDCHAVNEVSAAHCTPVHYNAYVHDLCTRANSKPEAVMNETLVNPAVCLWGISSCSLNHLRVAAQMVMDITDISYHIQYTVSHAGKEGIPIHHIAVSFHTSHLFKWKQFWTVLRWRQLQSHTHTQPCVSLTFSRPCFYQTFFFYHSGVSLKLKLHLLFHPKMPQDCASSLKHHAPPWTAHLCSRAKGSTEGITATFRNT